jgi:transcriptional regulator with XRE-family HTH domain
MKKEYPIKTDKALKQVGVRLRELRKEKGFKNYEHIAYELGMSRSQYWKYEQGGNIELATLLRVLNLLGVTLGEFFKDFD